MTRWLTAALLCLLALGCEDGPAPPSLVDSLRVLAIVAEPPEGPPGSDITVSAEVANPGGVDFTTRWHVCAAEERNVSEAILQYGGRVPDGGCPEDAPLRMELPGDETSVTIGGALTEAAVALALEADPRVDELLSTVGLPFVVQLTLEDPATGAPLLVAYKRVALTTRATPSTNPPPPSFTFGETPMSADAQDCGEVRVAAGAEVAIRPTPDEPWLEVHPRLALDGTLGEAREAAYYSLFATAGEVDTPITVAPERDHLWTAPPEPGREQMWLVVRDGHLGVSWCSFAVIVE